jgi:hypothetical protein
VAKGDDMKNAWREFRSELSAIVTNAKEWFALHQNLIQILSPQTTKLPKDFKTACELEQTISTYYAQHVAPQELKDNVVALQFCNERLEAFRREVEQIKYLRSIDLKLIWNMYGKGVAEVDIKEVFEKAKRSDEIFGQLKLVSVLHRLE